MEDSIHYPSPNLRQVLPQCPPASYRGLINSCCASAHEFQVGEKNHSTVRGLDAPMRSVLIRGHCQGAGVSHPENFSPPPGLRVAPDEDKTLADASPTHYPHQQTASKMVTSDQSYRSTPVGATPADVPITSVLPSSGFVQGESRNRSQRTTITNEKRAEEPSPSSGQPAALHEELKRPYMCRTCGKRYAQPGGVLRHHRAKHNPNSCAYCDASWSRPYQYRNHLEKHHRDVDADVVLGKPPGSRRRAEITGRGQPQSVSPHAIQYTGDRQNQAVPRHPPPMPPLPAVTKVPEPQVPSALSSAEEPVQLVNNVVDHSSGLPQALPDGFTTVNYPSSTVTAHIPFPYPPFGGFYSSLGSADLMLEPSRLNHPYHWPC